MTSLIGIFEEQETILAEFASPDIEVDEQQQAAVLAYLDELAQQETDKVDRIAGFMRYLDTAIQHHKEEERRMSSRRRSLEVRKQSLKDYLHHTLRKHNLRKVDGTTSSISLRKNPPSVMLHVPDWELPGAYVETRIEHKAMKSKIKEALKAGQEVPGATLEQTESIRIS